MNFVEREEYTRVNLKIVALSILSHERSPASQAFRARILSPNRRRVLVIYYDIKNGHGRRDPTARRFFAFLSFFIYEAGGNDTSGQSHGAYL